MFINTVQYLLIFCPFLLLINKTNQTFPHFFLCQQNIKLLYSNIVTSGNTNSKHVLIQLIFNPHIASAVICDQEKCIQILRFGKKSIFDFPKGFTTKIAVKYLVPESESKFLFFPTRKN